MRAYVADLKFVPPKPLPTRDTSRLTNRMIREHKESGRYQVSVIVEDPLYVTLANDRADVHSSFRRLEAIIRNAVQYMFHNPAIYENLHVAQVFFDNLEPEVPSRSYPTPNPKETSVATSIICDNCNDSTSARNPGAGWTELKSLYHHRHEFPEQPKHFCSQQCQVNHILKTTQQPIVLEAKP